jgi:hypothetical protein
LGIFLIHTTASTTPLTTLGYRKDPADDGKLVGLAGHPISDKGRRPDVHTMKLKTGDAGQTVGLFVEAMAAMTLHPCESRVARLYEATDAGGA